MHAKIEATCSGAIHNFCLSRPSGPGAFPLLRDFKRPKTPSSVTTKSCSSTAGTSGKVALFVKTLWICENTLEVIVQNFGDVVCCITGETIIAALHRCYGIADTLTFSHASIEWFRIALF